ALEERRLRVHVASPDERLVARQHLEHGSGSVPGRLAQHVQSLRPLEGLIEDDRVIVSWVPLEAAPGARGGMRRHLEHLGRDMEAHRRELVLELAEAYGPAPGCHLSA